MKVMRIMQTRNEELILQTSLIPASIKHRFRWLRSLFLLVLFALLGSCSTARLGYSNADTLAYWWLDDYVDFRSSQKAEVKSELAQMLTWHRTTQLPQYAQLLTQVQSKLINNPEPSEVAATIRQVEQFSQAILLKALPEITDIALSIDESQKVFLARKFEKNNESYRKKYLKLSSEKLAKQRLEKIINQADDWLGSVSREQELMINQYVDKYPQNNALWLENTMLRQSRVMQLLTQIQREKLNRESVKTMIQQLIITNDDTSESAEQSERRAQSDAARAGMHQLIANLIRTSSVDQKKYAHKKIQAWIDDCNYLIAKK
jgi:hypothetical protein